MHKVPCEQKGTEAHLSTLCAALVDGAAVIKTGIDELWLK